jgi:hypothetical protein
VPGSTAELASLGNTCRNSRITRSGLIGRSSESARRMNASRSRVLRNGIRFARYEAAIDIDLDHGFGCKLRFVLQAGWQRSAVFFGPCGGRGLRIPRSIHAFSRILRRN